jgi:hypothetical protein
MAVQNNPLRQFFRRPSVYLKLPSGGKFYPEGAIDMPENGELPVYPMTAIDDITTKTPDALFNGQAIVDIIKSCVPNILNPWSVSSVDLDSILLAIRSASSSDGLDVNSECPACTEGAEYKINLGGILSEIKLPDYITPFQIGELSIKFRPLSYKEMNEVALSQFEMQRQFSNLDSIEDIDERMQKSKIALQVVTEVTMNTIAKTIDSVVTPNGTEVKEIEYILDFLRNCDKNTFESIKDHNTKLREASEMKPLKIKCVHCQHDYQQPFTINISDFFV